MDSTADSNTRANQDLRGHAQAYRVGDFVEVRGIGPAKIESLVDGNYNGGDFIVTFRFKARNQKDADKKLATKLSNSGREFYALAAEHAPG